MSKESYVRGFCKVAGAAGVDPVALAKYAADINAVSKGFNMISGDAGKSSPLKSLGRPASTNALKGNVTDTGFYGKWTPEERAVAERLAQNYNRPPSPNPAPLLNTKDVKVDRSGRPDFGTNSAFYRALRSISNRP